MVPVISEVLRVKIRNWLYKITLQSDIYIKKFRQQIAEISLQEVATYLKIIF